ncbi:GIY-YIG nuclease family protein [Xenorhabdus littoralis]|uniref:GIY-YIG nuclease family protein n=1 Tax=Xenorhabdus littoralis TaxID=2582835 RepID=UPI0029E7E834|nr:GIY-YIG nuclease family protein [Xenorhabdus sp. psl]MDX7990224.1 GIY-YIG nuclease family protein [Xenorhabdus sp. psl]
MKTKVSNWYLYLIRTRNGSLYTGVTTDVSRRFMQHTSGKGAKALRGKGPLILVYQSLVRDRSIALKVEYRVKKLSKQQKERLILNQPLCVTTYLIAIGVSEKFFTPPESRGGVITRTTTTGYQNGQDK